MRYTTYYKQLFGGMSLFLWGNLTQTNYLLWIKNVTEYLFSVDKEPELIAEWDTLDNKSDALEIEQQETSPPDKGVIIPFSGDDTKHSITSKRKKDYQNINTDSVSFEEFLKRIAIRFEWLAKLKTGKLPSKDEIILTKLNAKRLSENEIMNFINQGINCLNSSENYYTHDRYHAWLRNTSNYFQKILPDSGLSAEWLSLPAITHYYVDDNSSPCFWSGDRSKILQTLEWRFFWLGNIFNLNSCDLIDKLEPYIMNNKLIRINTPSLFDMISKKPVQIWKEALIVLAVKFVDEAKKYNEERKNYFIKASKCYIDKHLKIIDGERLLSNYYTQCSLQGTREIHEKANKKLEEMKKTR
ncbi:MAG: hypothetical protein GF347_02545 [Candidatus Moranbacteria bacterium]|nr:hypothetical protein [Candidatus Moranbacteria bacterium]